MPDIRSNSKCHIMEIQKYLSGISYYNEKIPKIIPDGIYGKETLIAVRAFQQEYRLPITGEVNRVTWEKIVEVYKEFISIPETISIFPSNICVLKQGDKGCEIMFIQIMVNAVMESIKDFEKIAVTGFYDTATVKGIKEFQKLSHIRQTGSVNVETWNILVKSFNYIMR